MALDELDIEKWLYEGSGPASYLPGVVVATRTGSTRFEDQNVPGPSFLRLVGARDNHRVDWIPKPAPAPERNRARDEDSLKRIRYRTADSARERTFALKKRKIYI